MNYREAASRLLDMGVRPTDAVDMARAPTAMDRNADRNATRARIVAIVKQRGPSKAKDIGWRIGMSASAVSQFIRMNKLPLRRVAGKDGIVWERAGNVDEESQ